MTQINPNLHYVKFMRGSLSAWESLQTTPEKISDDTLYFIYQNAETSRDGKLYLGKKLISGTGDNYSGNININDIGDIRINDETLADKQILVYNETTENWENASLSTIINTAIGIMQGATASTEGQSGLVPAPQPGDQNKFLKGDGSWSIINIPIFDSDTFDETNEQEISLAGFTSASIGTIPIKTSNGLEWIQQNNSTLTRAITTMEDLREAVRDGTANENTIYMIANGSDPSLSNQYDEYMVIQNSIEFLGTFGEVNLSNYVTLPTFSSAISNINNVLNDIVDSGTGDLIPGLVSRVNTIENNYVTKEKIGDLSLLILTGDNNTLVEEVNNINQNVDNLSQRLRWHELNNG